MRNLKFFSKCMIRCIHFYQKHISPFLPRYCKYQPSCSEYTVQAIEKYGPIKGSLLGIWRILRCNPFSEGGYDPVP